MTKTIEEEIRTYAQMCSVDEAGYVAIEKAIQFGIDLHKSLPLSQRLTDEERERVRKMYADIHSRAAYYKSKMSKTDSPVCITHHCNSMEFYVAQIKLLESIFGKELFGEGEG